MNLLKRIAQLTEDGERKLKEAERARGGLDRVAAQIKEEFDCLPADGDKVLAKMQKEQEREEEKAEEAVEEYEKQFGEQLEGAR